jgi:acyl-CoA hydrolase
MKYHNVDPFFKVTEASFTYVAIDADGRKRLIPKVANGNNLNQNSEGA